MHPGRAGRATHVARGGEVAGLARARGVPRVEQRRGEARLERRKDPATPELQREGFDREEGRCRGARAHDRGRDRPFVARRQVAQVLVEVLARRVGPHCAAGKVGKAVVVYAEEVARRRLDDGAFRLHVRLQEVA